MNWENIDPQVAQLYSQLLYMQKQLMDNPPPDIRVDKFIISLITFINELGNAMQQQAV